MIVRDLHRSYGSIAALKGVTLDAEPGEIMALLGPNGAGKTTLVSIITGLRSPDSGYVAVDGIDVQRTPQAARRRMGFAPQETGIYPTLTVRENLMYFGKLADLRGSLLCSQVEAVAERLSLGALLARPARSLSGGERRRLHTAMALVAPVPLLLLDEPTAGMDVSTRKSILEFVRERANAGCAVCYSTHYLQEIEALDASVALLDCGQLIARGTMSDLIARHSRSAVELHFDGEIGDTPVEQGWEVTGDVIRVYTDAPPATAAAVLAALGPAARRLRSVEFVGPSLEGVFLALTGRRYAAEMAGAGNVATP